MIKYSFICEDDSVHSSSGYYLAYSKLLLDVCQSFYSVLKHFGKKNLKNFKVIVTFWDLRNINEEDWLKIQFETFFRKCNIEFAGFVEKSSDRLNIENLLGRNFTRQNDLDLVGTIFEI